MDTNANTSLLLGDIGVYGFRNVLNKHHLRAFNMGVMEQSMVSIAAGMASEGIIPTLHTIAPFLVERALEQIKIDFGYQELAGNFVSVGASFDYSALGCTHHCPSDVLLITNIPRSNVFVPGDAFEFKKMYQQNWDNGNINYFRLSEYENSHSFNIDLGESTRIQEGADAIAIVVGPLLNQVLEAIKELDIELHYINSFRHDSENHIEVLNSSRKLILIEPYYSGLVLSKVTSQFLAKNYSIYQIGVPRSFLRKYGTYQEMLAYVELDSKNLRKRIVQILND